MERQIEQLIELIKSKIQYDKTYIINYAKRDIMRNSYDYIPEFKRALETKIKISESYVRYLEEIVKYLESILK